MLIKNLATISHGEKMKISLGSQVVVANGKRSDKLKYYAKAEGKTGAKYCDVDNMARTGACSPEECVVLYRLAKFYSPEVILEVGTWFGTTAWTLAQVGKVYTCDKHDLFVGKQDNIEFYHGPSTKFWKKLGRRGIKTDFIWADASLKVGDIERMLPLYKDRIRFAVHDYEKKEKGWRNMRALGEVLGKKIEPEVEGIIAFYEA